MRILVGAFVLLLLAGCADVDETPRATEIIAKADEETGAIKGVVLDESLLPVNAALVGLDEGNATLTDANGAFAYSHVPPGQHRVSVQGVSIEPKSVMVDVQAGQVSEVTVTVAILPAQTPYHETVTQDGITFCGTSFRQPGQAQPAYLQICGALFYAGLTDYDRFRLDWQIAMPGLTGLWGESVWQRNSAASGGYNVLWDVFANGGNIYDIGQNGSGHSPIQVRIERATIDAQVEAHGDDECKADAECHIASFHANFGETLGPAAPADAAVSVMQRYSVYLTKFYHGELPSIFTALADS